MSLRAALLFIAAVAAALAAPVAQARAQTPLTATGFNSNGVAMAGWRWLANDEGDAYIAWTFSHPRIATDDLHLQFAGVAAFAPGSGGTVTLRIHYGFPGSGQQGGVLAETTLTLAAAAPQSGVVGVPVTGELLITAAMMDAVAPAARRLIVRIEQKENPGATVAFNKQGLIVTPMEAATEETPMAAATAFDSNGDLIQGWYWLRDAALRHRATWRFDNMRVPENGLQLTITALATNKTNGGPGFDAQFILRYGTEESVLRGAGGTLLSVRLPNVSPPGDPVGYTTRDTIVLPAVTLGGAGRTGPLYLRVERPSAKGPHVAFNARTMAIPAAGLSEDQTVALTVSGGGRVIVSSRPFMVAKDAVGGATDPDGDGVLQAFEEAALRRLNPRIQIDEDENWFRNRSTDKVMQFARVTAYPSRQVPRYLLLYFATTWSRDYGRDTLGIDLYDEYVAQRHNGDVERVIEAWEIVGEQAAELRWVFTSAHFGPTYHSGVWAARGRSCNYGKVVAGSDQTICATLQFDDGRVKLQASESKHAFYPTVGACEDVRLVVNAMGTGVGEDCGGGRTFTFAVYNAGEPDAPLLDDIGSLFAGERIWSSAEFCGGTDGTYNPDLPCVGRVGKALTSPEDIIENKLSRAPKTIPDGTALMYEHVRFGGWAVALKTTSAIPDLSRIGGGKSVNDLISSIKIGRGITCTFWMDKNYKGAKLGPWVAADAPDGEWLDLSFHDVLSFNDRISSVRCAPAP